MKLELPAANGALGTLPYGHVMRRSHTRFTRALARALRPHGVAVKEYRILRALYMNDGQTQSELSARVEIEKGALTNLFRSMEADGYIERRPDEVDARKLNVFLARRGKTLRSKLMGVASMLNQLAGEGISAADLTTTIGVLEKMIANLANLA